MKVFWLTRRLLSFAAVSCATVRPARLTSARPEPELQIRLPRLLRRPLAISPSPQLENGFS